MVCRGNFPFLVLTAVASFMLTLPRADAHTLTVTDDLGRSVTIDVPAKRAVITTTYELIPALGIWNQVAGVSRWATLHNDLYRALIAEHPEWSLPIAGTSGTDVNVEAIMRLHPDIVITWSYNPQVVSFLEEKGITVLAIYPRSIKELLDMIRLHGKIFGKENRAEEVIIRMENIFDIVKKRVDSIPPDRRKKAIELGGKPTTVFTSKSLFDEALRVAGAENLAKPPVDSQTHTVEVSVETIVRWNPDAIFIWGNAGYGAEDILENTQWRSIKAVREKQVWKLPGWSTWSPRLALLVLWIAKKLYPEAFYDVNFEDVANRFYQEIFGISYEKAKIPK